MKKIKKIKYKYRDFTILEKFDVDAMSSTFYVSYGLLRTKPIASLIECHALIDECYRRAETKKRRKAGK